ncbi:MAG: prephenate dehydrogenase/arogenate dehydrogenase family protein, partial [Solirubrobacteraceae bacterium]
ARPLRVAVLGLGLIGGSIGLAARRRAGARVSGWDPHTEARARALELGAVDEIAPDLARAVADADAVFVAAPVGVIAQTVQAALQSAGAETVVTDVGSTKRAIVESISDPRFLGGHPLAGLEAAGVEHAREDLFEQAIWYLSVAGDAPGDAYERLHRLIVSFGAKPVPLDADTHDRLMASVSHLPHVLANLLVAQVAAAQRDQGEPSALPGTLGIGPSFRDATRVAGSNSEIWTDIYISNREALVQAIDELTGRLARVRSDLQAGDASAVRDWNERARVEHETLLRPGS